MTNRNARAQIAQQTLDIIERGSYELPNGSLVSISEPLQKAIAGLIHYTPESFANVFEKREQILARISHRHTTKFEVVNSTTLSAAALLAASKESPDIVCLNFASAHVPGGGFLSGSGAQEESLARNSGLYPCIAQLRGYYAANRMFRSSLYADDMCSRIL